MFSAGSYFLTFTQIDLPETEFIHRQSLVLKVHGQNFFSSLAKTLLLDTNLEFGRQADILRTSLILSSDGARRDALFACCMHAHESKPAFL
jgi:hypothetical protein